MLISNEYQLITIGNIEDVRLVSLEQTHVDVQWIHRESNKVAHTLTNWAKSANLTESLWNSLLTSSNKLVQYDFQLTY